jgi:cell division protein FtsB
MSTSESEKKGLRNRKQKEQDAPEVLDPEHKKKVQTGVPKHTEKGKQDKEDEHKQVPVQVPAAKLAEIKQQWDEVKRLIKENRPHLSISWSAVIFVTTLAVVGCLAYTGWLAYGDLVKGQQNITVSQNNVLKNLDKLRRDFEREIKELKSQLGDAVRAGSADEIKLLKSVESSVRRLEERVKAKKP